jgi:hypothetical protein
VSHRDKNNGKVPPFKKTNRKKSGAKISNAISFTFNQKIYRMYLQEEFTPDKLFRVTVVIACEVEQTGYLTSPL